MVDGVFNMHGGQASGGQRGAGQRVRPPTHSLTHPRPHAPGTHPRPPPPSTQACTHGAVHRCSQWRQSCAYYIRKHPPTPVPIHRPTGVISGIKAVKRQQRQQVLAGRPLGQQQPVHAMAFVGPALEDELNKLLGGGAAGGDKLLGLLREEVGGGGGGGIIGLLGYLADPAVNLHSMAIKQ